MVYFQPNFDMKRKLKQSKYFTHFQENKEISVEILSSNTVTKKTDISENPLAVSRRRRRR
jgi:hypothetical protein